jgi:nitric oxide reductase NorD protein
LSRKGFPSAFDYLEKELAALSPSLAADFRRALAKMPPDWGEAELGRWAQEGLELARQAWRAWEASAEYYLASPQVLALLGPPAFWDWAQQGRELTALSSALAAAYYRASPSTLPIIGRQGLVGWVGLGRHLYKGSWRSASLAVQFFEHSPALFSALSLSEAAVLVRFLDVLCDRSYDLASHCLGVAPHVLRPLQGGDRLAFLRFAEELAAAGWADARAYLERGPALLAQVEPAQRARFLALASRIISEEGRQAFAYFAEAGRALAQVSPALHGHLLGLAEELAALSPVAAMEFLKSLPRVLPRLKPQELWAWHQEGLAVLHSNPEGGEAYFRLESSRAEEMLDALSSRLDLSKVSDVLRLYCKALTGADVAIHSSEALAQKGIGWVRAETPTTEGSAIFLPPAVDEFPEKERNFSIYKVYATHQAGHLEFGSFLFRFEAPAHLFPSLRQEREQRRLREPGEGDGHRQPLTDMERFFDLFDNRRLAADLFTVVEDTRIDACILREYAGIRADYRLIQARELQRRPPLEELPLVEAFLENLVRASLGGYDHLSWPPSLMPLLREALAVLQAVQRPEATVEDAAEATIRLYDLVASLPNLLMDQSQEEWQNPQQEEPQPSPAAAGQGQQLQGEEQPYQSPQPVEFRGEFKPELVQLLGRLRQERQGQQPPSPLSPEQIRALLEKSVEIDLQDGGEQDLQQSSNLFLTNLKRELAQEEQEAQKEKQRERRRTAGLSTPDPSEQPLSPEPRYFYYDEWDFRAGDYKPRWCRIVEYTVAEGTASYFDQTLSRYAALASQTRRQFELLKPELFRKIKRLLDGEELDLDAVIDYLVEREAGVSPPGKVYWRRNKVERDVAVAFLLDMSASTDEEIIKHSRRLAPDDFDDDPRKYFAWWMSRRAQELLSPPKRIIDVEKESIVLLIRALETIGDAYGIFGFSGYGRENVEFYVIKELEEPFGERVKRRIDKIAPVRSTRMGPAIRHATYKLEQVEAKVRILFLVSDGRPQDHGYGRDRTEKEYAIHDTHMALLEAKRKGMVPFCLTVDRYGHDYLKQMCQDVGYAVVPDVESLPSRITQLYRELTR